MGIPESIVQYTQYFKCVTAALWEFLRSQSIDNLCTIALLLDSVKSIGENCFKVKVEMSGHAPAGKIKV